MKKIIKYLETQDNRMKVIYVTVFTPVVLSLLSVFIYDNFSEYMHWIVYLLQLVAMISIVTLVCVAVYDSLIKVQRRIKNKSEKEYDGKEFNQIFTNKSNINSTESER